MRLKLNLLCREIGKVKIPGKLMVHLSQVTLYALCIPIFSLSLSFACFLPSVVIFSLQCISLCRLLQLFIEFFSLCPMRHCFFGEFSGELFRNRFENKLFNGKTMDEKHNKHNNKSNWYSSVCSTCINVCVSACIMSMRLNFYNIFFSFVQLCLRSDSLETKVRPQRILPFRNFDWMHCI